MKQRFEANGIKFVFEVRQLSLPTIMFYPLLRSYASRYSLFKEEPMQLLKNSNAFKTFAKVKVLLKEYVNKFKPFAFAFSATDDKRRLRIYKKMIDKMKLIDYNVIVDNGSFYFYRKVK